MYTCICPLCNSHTCICLHAPSYTTCTSLKPEVQAYPRYRLRYLHRVPLIKVETLIGRNTAHLWGIYNMPCESHHGAMYSFVQLIEKRLKIILKQ